MYALDIVETTAEILDELRHQLQAHATYCAAENA